MSTADDFAAVRKKLGTSGTQATAWKITTPIDLRQASPYFIYYSAGKQKHSMDEFI